MSATLRVVHRTGYRYEDGATSSFNEARMTPRSDEHQAVLFSQIEITPGAWTNSFIDYWGTPVTAFELHEKHDKLTVVSTSTVDVHRRHDGNRSATWADLGTSWMRSEFAEFVDCGTLVTPPAELAALVSDLADTAPTPEAFVEQVLALVREHIAYVPGVTSVKTTAVEVWAAGAGVCQDLSHVLIGALRFGGVPARYVSGYLMPEQNTLDVPATGQSHAWVEYWVGSWVGVDPTSGGAVEDNHIVVGHGRDYSDVPPLKGVFTGGHAQDMFVEVTLTRLR